MIKNYQYLCKWIGIFFQMQPLSIFQVQRSLRHFNSLILPFELHTNIFLNCTETLYFPLRHVVLTTVALTSAVKFYIYLEKEEP